MEDIRQTAKDIDIDPIVLSNTISVLDKNNQEILDIIKNINDAIKDLDEKKWSAPNKKKLDEDLLPYIDTSERNITEEFAKCIYTLRYALRKYGSTDSNIQSEATKLSS